MNKKFSNSNIDIKEYNILKQKYDLLKKKQITLILENKKLKCNLDLSNNNLKAFDISYKLNNEIDNTNNFNEFKENDIISKLNEIINNENFEKSLINIIQSNNISVEAKFEEFKIIFYNYSKFIINIFSNKTIDDNSIYKNIEINEFFLTDINKNINESSKKSTDLKKTINNKPNEIILFTNNPERKFNNMNNLIKNLNLEDLENSEENLQINSFEFESEKIKN